MPLANRAQVSKLPPIPIPMIKGGQAFPLARVTVSTTKFLISSALAEGVHL